MSDERVTYFSPEELTELREEPMLVHTYDARRIVACILAQASGATLDVERLVEAWANVMPEAPFYSRRLLLEDGAKVAAEYARLSGDAVMEDKV